MADEEFWTLDSMLLEGEIAEQRAVSLDILDTRKSSRRTSVRPASSRGTGHSRSSQTQKSRDAKEEGDYEEEITLALSAAAEGSEDILLDCFSADSFASLLSRVLKHLNLRPASNEDIVPEAPKKEFSGDVVPESPKDRLSEEVAIATSTEDALNAESSPSENSAKLNSELRVQAELLDELSLRFQKTQKLLKDQNTRIAEANQEIFNLKELILGSNADDNQTVSNNNLMAPVSSLHKSGSSRNSIRFSANTEGINTGELEIPSPVGSNVAPTGELFLGSEVEEAGVSKAMIMDAARMLAAKKHFDPPTVLGIGLQSMGEKVIKRSNPYQHLIKAPYQLDATSYRGQSIVPGLAKHAFNHQEHLSSVMARQTHELLSTTTPDQYIRVLHKQLQTMLETVHDCIDALAEETRNSERWKSRFEQYKRQIERGQEMQKLDRHNLETVHAGNIKRNQRLNLLKNDLFPLVLLPEKQTMSLKQQTTTRKGKQSNKVPIHLVSHDMFDEARPTGPSPNHSRPKPGRGSFGYDIPIDMRGLPPLTDDELHILIEGLDGNTSSPNAPDFTIAYRQKDQSTASCEQPDGAGKTLIRQHSAPCSSLDILPPPPALRETLSAPTRYGNQASALSALSFPQHGNNQKRMASGQKPKTKMVVKQRYFSNVFIDWTHHSSLPGWNPKSLWTYKEYVVRKAIVEEIRHHLNEGMTLAEAATKLEEIAHSLKPPTIESLVEYISLRMTGLEDIQDSSSVADLTEFFFDVWRHWHRQKNRKVCYGSEYPKRRLLVVEIDRYIEDYSMSGEEAARTLDVLRRSCDPPCVAGLTRFLRKQAADQKKSALSGPVDSSHMSPLPAPRKILPRRISSAPALLPDTEKQPQRLAIASIPMDVQKIKTATHVPGNGYSVAHTGQSAVTFPDMQYPRKLSDFDSFNDLIEEWEVAMGPGLPALSFAVKFDIRLAALNEVRARMDLMEMFYRAANNVGRANALKELDAIRVTLKPPTVKELISRISSRAVL